VSAARPRSSQQQAPGRPDPSEQQEYAVFRPFAVLCAVSLATLAAVTLSPAAAAPATPVPRPVAAGAVTADSAGWS
jgi:hypothetical protein